MDKGQLFLRPFALFGLSPAEGCTGKDLEAGAGTNPMAPGHLVSAIGAKGHSDAKGKSR